MAINQNEQNIMCKAAYTEANGLVSNENPLYTKRLRTCNATVSAYESILGVVFVLKSYRTIVAMVDENGRKYDFLRYVYGYTATSAQHINKFFKDYGNDFTPAYTYRND